MKRCKRKIRRFGVKKEECRPFIMQPGEIYVDTKDEICTGQLVQVIFD